METVRVFLIHCSCWLGVWTEPG